LTHLLLLDQSTGELEASQKAVRDAKRNRNIITLQVQYPGGTKDEGEGIIEELTLSAGYDEMATMDVSIQGTGPITRI
jgi:predicted secreted protein